MVIGHVLSHDHILSIFIYKWHMPLFFFFSGFFFDPKKYTLKDFLIRKIKTIYIPFVVWSLLTLYLHNYLIKVHIDPLPYYDFSTFKLFTYRIIFELKQYEPLLVTFWFLIQLLIVNILAYLLFLFYKLTREKYLRFQQYVTIILSLSLCIIFNKYNICLYNHINYITFLALSFFFTGNILKSFSMIGKGKLISSLFIILISDWSFQEMINLNYNKTIFYYVAGISGIIIIYHLSITAENIKIIKELLSYIGKRSISIMILHFISFKLINILIIYYYKLPTSVMSDFPIIENVNILWQLLYIIGGVGTPLLLDKSYLITKNYIIKTTSNGSFREQ